MAKRLKKTIQKAAPKPMTEYERVTCRFRRHTNLGWTKGTLLVGAVNKDESLTIIDNGGNIRAVEPEAVEVVEFGPRGGTKWVPFK